MIYSIGDIIRKRRADLGFTQLNLAMKLFLQPQTIGKWERGESYPPLSSLKDIATSLKISIEFLLDEPENCYPIPPVNFDAQKFMDSIKYYRIHCGLNQAELAKILDTRSQTISKWENGVIMPDIFYFKKLCGILKVCPTDLLLALNVPKTDPTPTAKTQPQQTTLSEKITKNENENVLQNENTLQNENVLHLENISRHENVLPRENVLQNENTSQNTKHKTKKPLLWRKKLFINIAASILSVIMVLMPIMGGYNSLKNATGNLPPQNTLENPPKTIFYTLTIYDGVHDNPSNITQYEKGAVVNEPSQPYNKGYKFESWDCSFPFIINSDFVIRATVSKIPPQKYTVKFFEDGNSAPLSTTVYNEGDILDSPDLPFNAEFGYAWDFYSYNDDPEKGSFGQDLFSQYNTKCQVNSNINLTLKKEKINWFLNYWYTDDEKNAAIPILTELRKYCISLMRFYDALEFELLQAKAPLDYNATLKKINDKIPVFDFSSTIKYYGNVKHTTPPYGTNHFSTTGPKPLVYDNYNEALFQNHSMPDILEKMMDILLFAVYTFTGVEYTNTTGIYNEINNEKTLIEPLFANFRKVYGSFRHLYYLSDENSNYIRNELFQYVDFHGMSLLPSYDYDSNIEWLNFGVTY